MDTQQLVDFLKQNEDLIKSIASEAESLPSLFNKLEANRAQAQSLLPARGLTLNFQGSADHDVLDKQRTLVDQIAKTSQDIQAFQDEPDLQAGLLTHEAALYTALANTYDDSFSWVITFTQDEIDSLNVLLRHATLDAAARQRQADMLDAAVQISKFILSVMGVVLK